MKQNIKVQSGNRIAVKLDGIEVGLVQNVRSNDDYGHEPASGIGDIHAIEHVPSMARHSISVSTMILKKGSLRQAGITAENGDAVLQGLVFDIVTLDKESGEELRKYIGCSYVSGDIEVSKHAILMANAQFMALDVTGLAI